MCWKMAVPFLICSTVPHKSTFCSSSSLPSQECQRIIYKNRWPLLFICTACNQYRVFIFKTYFWCTSCYRDVAFDFESYLECVWIRSPTYYIFIPFSLSPMECNGLLLKTQWPIFYFCRTCNQYSLRLFSISIGCFNCEYVHVFFH